LDVIALRAVAAVLAFVLLAQNPQQPAPGTGSVSGIVVAMGSNEPIPNASVELRRLDCNSFANPPEVLTATSGADGRFVFKGVRPGGWCIVATMAGGAYTPAEYLQRGVIGRGVTIPLADGQNFAGIQLTMWPTGGINGRVQDGDGEPMAFARVQVLQPFYQDGRQRLYILQVAQTDDRGEYRFYWLPPGPYYVAAIPEDTRRREVISVRPPPGTGGHREDTAAPVVTRRIEPDGKVVEQTYVTVYYPGETDAERAVQVSVQPGSTTSGVDISFRSGTVPSFHVRGSAVNGVNGQPAAGAQIRVAPCEWAATVIMPGANADPNGHFDIAGVRAGCHVLYANATMPNPAAPPVPAGQPPQPPGPGAANNLPPLQLTAWVPLDVSADVRDLRLGLTPGINIAGEVVLEGASPDATPRGINISIARDPDLVGVPASQVRSPVQPNGTFTLQNVASGEYRLYVAPFLVPFQWGPPAVPQQLQDMYLKAVRVGRSDLLSEGFRVEGNSPGTIQVVLGLGGRVLGQANNESQQPASNVTVALIPDLARRRRPELYRSTTTDMSGRFQFRGVPPGQYKAFAWEVVEKDIWQIPEFIRRIEDRGALVEVREGVPANVQVVAIAAPR
jgi:hypothetical protein